MLHHSLHSSSSASRNRNAERAMNFVGVSGPFHPLRLLAFFWIAVTARGAEDESALLADDECRTEGSECLLHALQRRGAVVEHSAALPDAGAESEPDNSSPDRARHCLQPYEQCGGIKPDGSQYAGETCCHGGYYCTEVNANWKQCNPTKAGDPHFVYKPTKELTEPSKAPLLTYYVYRAESADSDYFDNVNVGNLAGTLWYLHNEVVWMTPRKFNITRLQRFKVSSRAPQPLYNLGMNFGVRYAYDAAQCTGPWNCDLSYGRYGYFVGCNNLGEFPFPTYQIYYEGAKWYTLPGPCPANTWQEKDAKCIKDQPGGLCEGTPTGAGDCTYSIEHAGEISIDEMTGIEDYGRFISEGHVEFNKADDEGDGLEFWNKMNDTEANAERMAKVDKLFKDKFPDMPSDADLPSPTCDFRMEQFYKGITTTTTTTSTTTTTTATTTVAPLCKVSDRCSGAVRWAMQHGIRAHPEWYPGLSKHSSFSDFQAQIHRATPDVCPTPCHGNSKPVWHASPATPAAAPAPVAPAGCR
ncbi:miaA, partial [Symbiodinium sp. KB8]